MIIDMTTELRDYTYITNIYKCISNYNLMGHQIGRKIGDMLEILTMGSIYNNEDLKKHLATEGKLEGYTSAEHKVEFGFFDDPKKKKNLFGAIECKCVGVEETKATSGHTQTLKVGDSFDILFNPHWLEEQIKVTITLKEIHDTSATVELTNTQDDRCHTILIPIENNIKLIIDEHQKFLNTTPNGDMLTEIPSIIRMCKTVKLKSISKTDCTFTLWNCLTGPQTIEKAKQASLVAMDLRKKTDGCWGKEDLTEDKKTFTFIHVLCEFSHWEEKSRNVIRTCIDHNLLIPDAILIHAFNSFEGKFGTADMRDFITKKQFEKNPVVRELVFEILNHFDNHILYDIEQNQYVNIILQDNKLQINPL